MAADDPAMPEGEGPDMSAGEYALGLLEGDERAEAQRRVLSDPEFAREVEWWQARFAALIDQVPEAEPSQDVWTAIERQVAAEGGSGSVSAMPEPETGLKGWKLGAVLLGTAAAAALATLLVVNPQQTQQTTPPVVAEPEPQLFAQLEAADAGLTLATRIDPATNRLTVRTVGFVPDDPQAQTPVLWVVPEGGAPVALGMIPEQGETARELSPAERDLLVEGALVAVTFEDRALERFEAPTDPILIAGPLTSL